MPIEKTDIVDFLEKSQSLPVLDVRSPSEYAHAHIPNAYSIPVFTDEQRIIIGTAYIKESREIAVNHGIDYFSERMKLIPGEVFKLLDETSKSIPQPDREILIHCWRGGMRSEAVAWLLSLYGYKIYLLRGGYKAFRQWVLQQFEKPYSLKILGGFTGAGKTQILKELKSKGEKVIDLEGMANHRGSAFGGLGQSAQPFTEMFENQLAIALWKCSKADEKNNPASKKSAIWLEDESIHIGTVGIPKPFWQQMRNSPLYFLEVPFEERLKNVLIEYGEFPKEKLVECILKIQKRLGGLDAKNAINFVENSDLKAAFSILLKYYDKMYDSSLHKRDNIPTNRRVVKCEKAEIKNAEALTI